MLDRTFHHATEEIGGLGYFYVFNCATTTF